MKSKIHIEKTSTGCLGRSIFLRALAAVLLLAVPLLTSCGGGGSSAAPPPPPPPTVAVVISPNTVTLPAGGAQTFTATVEGSANTAVTWSVQEGAAGGTITSSGVYTAPQAPGTYHVVATSVADNTKSATATLTVPPVSVTISPKAVSLGKSETQTFTAAVIGLLNTAVIWSVQEGPAGGAISSTGFYMAPATLGTFHVVATSQADSTKSDTATVTVMVSVAIQPAQDILGPGGVRAFTAFVTGATNTAVVWSVKEGAAGGTITSMGVYTAPATLGTFHVIATSVSDPSQSAMATVTVVASGFQPTGSMATARTEHTATLLPNGKVLVAGGCEGDFQTGCIPNTTAPAELFDPATGSFIQTSSLEVARDSHTATLLPNGKVLLAGGSTGPPTLTSLRDTSTAELYDPAIGSFTLTGSLIAARERHTATLLPNGKVLVAGGFGDSGAALATAELYDPGSGLFTPTGNMSSPRASHKATLLPNGRVLVVGGYIQNPPVPTSTAELYDPNTGVFTPTGMMTDARAFYTATLLPDGKVLVAGGRDNQSDSLQTVERFDPVTGSFVILGSMQTARDSHTATLLANGLILIAGGFESFSAADPSSCASCPDVTLTLAAAELFEPASGNSAATGSLGTARTKHTATPLENGKVLIVGGFDSSGSTLASAEIYQ